MSLRICLLIPFLLLARSAPCQDWEKLISPGDLIQGHADLESDCFSCHRPFKKKEQRDLCMNCHDHEVVRQDIEAGEGFHGLSEAQTVDCRTCHTEHKGRDADILGLVPETFNHSQTDYPLHGLHASTPCSGCHEADEAYRDASQDCVDCHREDDAHHETLGEDCGDCHEPTGWQANDFDHDETDFPLKGEHDDVGCTSCHSTNKFDEAPSNCVACHSIGDVHRGLLGSDCATCHQESGWDDSIFDHSRDTKFRLRGSHRKASCTSCHADNPYERAPASDCISCHRADDEHKGRFGDQCGDCHNEKRWTAETFDHGKTDFPLKGAHAQVNCTSCHTGLLAETELEKDCRGCHLGDDVHDSQLGSDCGSCHSENGWSRNVFFDHDLTRFPLLGVHGVASCESCHSDRKFHNTPLDCTACHRDDDYHKRSLGDDCAQCHNPNGWPFWQFDHNTQTEFTLDGGHAELRCEQCHTAPVSGEISMPLQCGGCHSSDDVHSGSYGHDCARCHSTDAWNRVERIR